MGCQCCGRPRCRARRSAAFATDESLRLQPVSDRVPEAKREAVVQHLTEYALAWGAWRRDELSPPDYLEAQHSLLTNLALDLAEDVNNQMPYPQLIKALVSRNGGSKTASTSAPTGTGSSTGAFATKQTGTSRSTSNASTPSPTT